VSNPTRQVLAVSAFTEHPLVDRESVRVRFFRLGPYSLDIDVFAYLAARDWNHFLETQEQLLFDITGIVSRAGTAIAIPSQSLYVANTSLPTRVPGVPAAADHRGL